tara:strand:- start:281 stop:493 length:213 start_codon:yes stop_codon:yes gene_type:complete
MNLVAKILEINERDTRKELRVIPILKSRFEKINIDKYVIIVKLKYMSTPSKNGHISLSSTLKIVFFCMFI